MIKKTGLCPFFFFFFFPFNIRYSYWYLITLNSHEEFYFERQNAKTILYPRFKLGTSDLGWRSTPPNPPTPRHPWSPFFFLFSLRYSFWGLINSDFHRNISLLEIKCSLSKTTLYSNLEQRIFKLELKIYIFTSYHSTVTFAR